MSKKAKKTVTNPIKKPVMETIKYYRYSDCVDYVESILKKPLRNFAEKQDFWIWLLDNYDLNNGAFFTLYAREAIDPNKPSWLNEILECFAQEFGDEIDMRVSW